MAKASPEDVFCASALALSTITGAASIVLAIRQAPLFALGVVLASFIFKVGCLGLGGLQRALGRAAVRDAESALA